MAESTNALLQNILSQLGDMREDIGGINAKLESGAALHKTFAEQLDIIDRRTDIIEDKTFEIDSVLSPKEGPTLVKRIAALEVFQGKLGAIIGGASMVIGGIFWFIWGAITWLYSHWSDVRDGVGRFFNH